MCGINGIIYKSYNSKISSQLQLMNDRIINRGPDDAGQFCTDTVAMGMRRLSIIDLSGGHQPMFNDVGNIIIVFNGEIYNYKILKAEIEADGIKFKTNSDTEVILKLYEKYGENLLSKLNGMFAFAIYDKTKNQIFIARDRFGEKPLYYYHDNGKFIWASELKSIVSVFPELKKINKDALTLFLSLTYIPAPLSIYQNVYKLLPGHYIKINTLTLDVDCKQYWDINLQEKARTDISYINAQKHIRTLLSESVEQRMIADVPLGVFLSGGVDSTIIAAIMSQTGKKIKTFSVGYKDKRYDESVRASKVATHIGSEHHEYMLDYKDIYNEIDKIVLNYDEPFADSSCLPTWFISSKTVQQVKVALTGDGGDEVFGGYNKYMLPYYRKKADKYVPAPLKRLITSESFSNTFLSKGGSKSIFSKARKVVGILNEDLIGGHVNLLALGFRQNELNQLFIEEVGDYKELLVWYLKSIPSDMDELKQLRYADKQISLEGDMLVKVDRASMLCSLECRSPFLDHRLMEYTYTLPDEYLIKTGNKKRILKDTFKDLLPDGFFNAPKSGFEIPVGEWFKGGLKNDLLDTLAESELVQTGLFNIKYINQLVNDHLSNKANNARQLWTLYCFQKWFKINMMNNA